MKRAPYTSQAEFGKIVQFYAIGRVDHEHGPMFNVTRAERQLHWGDSGESVRYANYHWDLQPVTEFDAMIVELKAQSLPGPIYSTGIEIDRAKALPFILLYKSELSRPAPTN